ncbi:MAG: hypothetical protein LBR32_06190 [Propionibacteriaceae bacterium]|jgi:hypothetical protein|nr:hypothetical protein [Propionibacteriaceae bacterium]
MAVTPLSLVQQAMVLALVQSGRLDVVPADMRRAAAFMGQAAERIGQLELLTSSGVGYAVAYDAAHDIGEAMLAAYGLRTASGPGQHDALGRAMRIFLDAPPGDKAARQFDRLRRARNQSHYDAKPIGAADAAKAETVARELHAAAIARGIPG